MLSNARRGALRDGDTSMYILKFGVLGAGFWARFQLAGWRETDGVECVAIVDPHREKAERLAREFDIRDVYDDAEKLFADQSLDFVDIISSVESHGKLVRLAANNRTNVVCQKPISTSLQEAEEMVEACSEAGVQFLINENWRWQAPIRKVASVLESGIIGKPFRARIDMISGFPVFINQPALKHLSKFILTDMGTHLLDVARFLFGETHSLYCQTRQVHADIAGEDVATVVLGTEAGATVIIEMAYAENHLERDRFPETTIFIEGAEGSIELAPDYWVRVTTRGGTHSERIVPPRYIWADPIYDVVHASIVPCQLDLLRSLRGESRAETAAADNILTTRLVFAAYRSSEKNQVIQFPQANQASR